MVTCACSVNTASGSPAALSVLPIHHVVLPKPWSSVQLPPQPSHSNNSQVALIEQPPTVAAIKHAVHLARAAAQAAKEAASLNEIASTQSGHELLLLLSTGEGEDSDIERGSRNNAMVIAERRKRRRRKRRKAFGLSACGDFHEDDDNDDANASRFLLDKRCSSRLERSRYLTPRQEAEFSCYLKEEAMLDTEVQQLREWDSLDSGHAADYARMKRRSDKAFLRARECRERITLSYKRLVASIATTYHGKGLSIQDLIQEGCIGLLRGAQRFDHKKGYKLSTYVYWWIKQGITRAIANKSRLVRLPGNMCEAMNKVAEANSLLKGQLGRWPSHEEIADFINMDVSNVRIVCERSRPPTSIDQIGKEGLQLKEIIHGQDETRPETIVFRQLLLQNLEKVLKTLSKREEYIVTLHYGLNGETARSCEEIGRLMNLSRERVRQIHCTALTRLREDKSFIQCLESVV